MRWPRLRIGIEVEFGPIDPPYRETDLYATAERAHPDDDVSERAEMDARRRVGFAPAEDDRAR